MDQTQMPNVTVTVDEQLKARMADHPEINWSQVARNAFESKVEDLELLDALAADSELTTAEAERIADRIDERVARRLVEQ